MGRRIASESKQTVRGGPKPAKVGLHRRLHTAGQIDFLSTKSQPVLPGLDPSTIAPEGFEWYL